HPAPRFRRTTAVYPGAYFSATLIGILNCTGEPLSGTPLYDALASMRAVSVFAPPTSAASLSNAEMTTRRREDVPAELVVSAVTRGLVLWVMGTAGRATSVDAGAPTSRYFTTIPCDALS